MNKYINNDSVMEPQVTQVGFEFEAGSETNAEIEELLGSSDAPKDYCADPSLSLKALKQLGIEAFVAPTVSPKYPKPDPKFVPKFVAIFYLADVIHITIPMDNEGHAAAAALWFVLGNKSRLT